MSLLSVDPIRFEVIRNAMLAVVEEMGAALKRSAYSTNIKTRADFSCGFFDQKCRIVVQAFAQPTHLASLVEVVPNTVKDYGVENLSPGDGIIVNDVHRVGGVHLNDIAVVSPVFVGDEIFGYVANIAHHV
nr:hydantoinase B/oxoprolinase family protein [Nitrososphaeria archaeon]